MEGLGNNPCQTGCVVSSGAHQRELLVLDPELWHLFGLPPCPFSPFSPSWAARPALKLCPWGRQHWETQLGSFYTAGPLCLLRHLFMGRRDPVCASRAVGRTALPKPGGKSSRSMALSFQGHPFSPQPNSSAAPCGQLQTAGGGTRAPMAWMPALFLPTAKGCSRIHFYNQRW